MTLHVAIPDKFTRPFYHYLTSELKLERQQFLFLGNPTQEWANAQNVQWIQTPIKSRLIQNLYRFFSLTRKADRIVLHGDALIVFFALFPWILKKTAWVIYGQELYGLQGNNSFFTRLRKWVYRQVGFHITHIEGDSKLANQMLKSKAKWLYSPMYLSNVTRTNDFLPQELTSKSGLKIMVGNSTDPANNHRNIFEMILPYQDQIDQIYCPLSYGTYEDYKKQIIALGREWFAEKFVVIDQFMDFETYKKFINQMDVVIFDHHRQEAMGVTLTLLSLGKIIYMNAQTTSFESLTSRGFCVFDNQLITQQGLKVNREVTNNRACLEKYYSHDVFNQSWKQISQLQ